MKNHSIVISRTDSIGDVILTLPLVGYLKKNNPNSKIIFLGRNYTIPILNCCSEIDEIWSWDDEFLNEKCQKEKPEIIYHVFPKKEIAFWAKKMNISQRIGTRGRWYHWLTCNKLLSLSRKNSKYHEAQLNLNMVLSENQLPELKNLTSLFHFHSKLSIERKKEISEKYLKKDKFNLILHPKSQGSAREWPLKNYLSLAKQLPENQFNILISGTEKEAKLMEQELKFLPQHARSICGELQLEEFIALIEQADGLIAASTGPLHIAAVCGILNLGLFPPMKPIHPGRWAPIGEKSEVLVKNIECSACKKTPLNCICIQELTVNQVVEKVHSWNHYK